MMHLPADYVRSILAYDGETGLFIWREARGCKQKGALAGTISAGRGRPYRQIKINRRFYYAHKLVWLVVHGAWPDQLDHINGDSLDNRLANLRLCTMSQNKANSRTYKNNTSGFKGVSRHGDKWRAYLNVNGTRINLGVFCTRSDAALAYQREAAFHFGEFARAS